VVSAIIAMGKNLKLRVIAEGIETRAQLAFLQSRHCAEGQGYLFSRPLAAEQCAELLGMPRQEICREPARLKTTQRTSVPALAATSGSSRL
jgi:EAL domain-containing protein (putative c-di-GMP-specific phosphodiesterase class I)